MPELTFSLPTSPESLTLPPTRLRYLRKTVRQVRRENWGGSIYEFKRTFCRYVLVGRAIPCSRRSYAFTGTRPARSEERV